MKEVQLYFSNKARSEACIFVLDRQMYVSVSKIMVAAKEEKMSFDDIYAQVISHELIHQILYDAEGSCAAARFDNICFRKYPAFKDWFGGVGGNNADE